jgi:hypothetical protein
MQAQPELIRRFPIVAVDLEEKLCNLSTTLLAQKCYLSKIWRRRNSTLRSMRAALVGTRWFATLEMLKAKDLRFPA